MARYTCAISGIRIGTSYFDSLALSNEAGLVHPIFAVPRDLLYKSYQAHCLGKLSAIDSYLLFLAFLNSSEKILWDSPSKLDPQSAKTRSLVETNFSQLVSALEKTDLIQHPDFSQPSFRVYLGTSLLDSIPNWIEAWEDNTSYFYSDRATKSDLEVLQKLENKLTECIYGTKAPEKYAKVIANWASWAAKFPAGSNILWKQTIEDCFSITKMFNTPLELLKEIKDFIECNIPVGSIHFHAIEEVLKEGIAKHKDYLGGSSLALGYTLLPSLEDFEASLAEDELVSIREENSNIEASIKKEQSLLATIASKAEIKEPVKSEYKDSISYLKAKLAYKVAKNLKANS